MPEALSVVIVWVWCRAKYKQKRLNGNRKFPFIGNMNDIYNKGRNRLFSSVSNHPSPPLVSYSFVESDTAIHCVESFPIISIRLMILSIYVSQIILVHSFSSRSLVGLAVHEEKVGKFSFNPLSGFIGK